MKKAGVITVHKNVNYGANLQAFASVKYLNSIGVDTKLVDYVLPSQDRCASLFGWLRESWANGARGISLFKKTKLLVALLLSAPWKGKRLSRFARFRKRHIPITGRCTSASDVARIGLDTIVVGSDQIWAPIITEGVVNPVYYGEIDGVKTRVSYAASIGGTQFRDEEERLVSRLVSAIDYASVREESTAVYLRRIAKNDIEVVCDPVFLLDKPQYEKIERRRLVRGKYVLLYSVVHNDKLSEIAAEYARSQNLPLVEICTGHGGNSSHKKVGSWGPREFLGAIHDADAVITNSFHGTAFSIIYQKQFFVVNNKDGGSRITNLLEKVGLNRRLIDEVPNAVEPIDYDAVNQRLTEYVNKSKAFLKKALSVQKQPLAGVKCTGCGACSAVCKFDAIRLVPNVEGFVAGLIDEQKCVSCNQCRNVCPALNDTAKFKPISVYAFKAKDDTRRTAASGGAFSALADVVLSQGGAVYGAVMGEDFTVSHTRVDNKDDLNALRGTKYVQSRIEHCYSEIEADLNAGRKVLFSGTPCQVDGAIRFVEKKGLDAGLLFTTDIICHGAPAPAIFAQFKTWLVGWLGEKITQFEFRSKRVSWRGESCRAVTESGRVIKGDKHLSAYMNLYYSNNITRDSCYSCQYAAKHRVSDLTISDYWGIEKLDKDFEDALGVSMVLVNTEKGKRLFDSAEGERILGNLECAKQPQLNKPVARPDSRDEFWTEYNKNGLKKLLKTYGGVKRDSLKTTLYNLRERMLK